MSEKRYDEEFQCNAVDLWIKGGESAKQIADELWVSGNCLSNWKKKYLSEEGGPQQTAL